MLSFTFHFTLSSFSSFRIFLLLLISNALSIDRLAVTCTFLQHSLWFHLPSPPNISLLPSNLCSLSHTHKLGTSAKCCEHADTNTHKWPHRVSSLSSFPFPFPFLSVCVFDRLCVLWAIYWWWWWCTLALGSTECTLFLCVLYFERQKLCPDAGQRSIMSAPSASSNSGSILLLLLLLLLRRVCGGTFIYLLQCVYLAGANFDYNSRLWARGQQHHHHYGHTHTHTAADSECSWVVWRLPAPPLRAAMFFYFAYYLGASPV